MFFIENLFPFSLFLIVYSFEFMLSVIRKNQHSLTFLIVLLTIISFIWLYNRTNLSQVGVNDVASIYGHVIQKASIEREAREYRLAIALGLTEFVRDLGGFIENEETALSSFIFNAFVIQHEAPRLNIVPSDETIAATIQSLPLFQTEGVFDSTKYALFMQEQLAPRGFTERHLEEVVRDSLYLKNLKKIITAPVVVSDAQIRESARIYQPISTQVIKFSRDIYLKNLKKESVTLEEKKAFYDKNKNLFVSEERCAVNYVVFTLPPEKQKLQGKERVRAMQQLSEQIMALKQKVQDGQQSGKPFEKVIKESGATVASTGDFNKKGEELVVSGKKIPQEFIVPSFQLSKVGDVSEVIQSGQNFYILSLIRRSPVRNLGFAEVEPKIDQILREQKASVQMKSAATKASQIIHDAMRSGKTFSEAAALANQKPETLSDLSFGGAASHLSPFQRDVFIATLSLKEGEISDLRHASWGEFLVYLQQRAPLSEKDWTAHHATIEQEFLEQQKGLLFFEWLQKARANAKIVMFDGKHRRNLWQSLFGR